MKLENRDESFFPQFGASSLGGVFHDIKEKKASQPYSQQSNQASTSSMYPLTTDTTKPRLFGKALKDIPRDRYYLSTKVGRYGKDGVNTWDYSAKRATESVYESMERLNIDFIDLINVHDIEFADLNQVVSEPCRIGGTA